MWNLPNAEQCYQAQLIPNSFPANPKSSERGKYIFLINYIIWESNQILFELIDILKAEVANHFDLFWFVGLPFGLRNLSKTFQKFNILAYALAVSIVIRPALNILPNKLSPSTESIVAQVLTNAKNIYKSVLYLS